MATASTLKAVVIALNRRDTALPCLYRGSKVNEGLNVNYLVVKKSRSPSR